MKLHLGCGGKRLVGWINVDRVAPADEIVDLEQLPWPWETSSVDEVLLVHVLEHLGQTSAAYLGIIKELWRVCKHGAKVIVAVPHPRHDHFINDPTHVRPITPDGLALFSQDNNRAWQKIGASNSCLGLELGIDLELISAREIPDPAWEPVKSRDRVAWEEAKRHNFNVVAAYEIELRVQKHVHGR